MSTIKKIVTIPPDRRVLLDCAVPEDIPEGMAEVAVSFHPVDITATQQKTFMDYFGALKDSPALEGDSVALQRAMRDE